MSLESAGIILFLVRFSIKQGKVLIMNKPYSVRLLDGELDLGVEELRQAEKDIIHALELDPCLQAKASLHDLLALTRLLMQRQMN
jgi:hypothetical protein